jgi:hypothetical protein
MKRPNLSQCIDAVVPILDASPEGIIRQLRNDLSRGFGFLRRRDFSFGIASWFILALPLAVRTCLPVSHSIFSLEIWPSRGNGSTEIHHPAATPICRDTAVLTWEGGSPTSQWNEWRRAAAVRNIECPGPPPSLTFFVRPHEHYDGEFDSRGTCPIC